MIPNFRRPKEAINKAFLKVKPNRTEIEGIKFNLIKLIDRINERELKNPYLLEVEVDHILYEMNRLSEEEIGRLEGGVG
jgi:hypothetical protein